MNAEFTALLGKTVIPFVVIEYQDQGLENVEALRRISMRVALRRLEIGSISMGTQGQGYD